MLNKKVGFDKDQVLLIQGTNTLENKLEAFKDDLLKSSEIKSCLDRRLFAHSRIET